LLLSCEIAEQSNSLCSLSSKSIANGFGRLRSIEQKEVLIGNAGYSFR
jgi:hypothetical protein